MRTDTSVNRPTYAMSPETRIELDIICLHVAQLVEDGLWPDVPVPDGVLAGRPWALTDSGPGGQYGVADLDSDRYAYLD